MINSYGLSVPMPLTLTAIGSRHRIVERDGWRILTPRHRPTDSLEGHLTFALKHERLDLAVLKRLFLAVEPGQIEAVVRSKPSGIYARRVWFLFEWLTGRTLDIPNLAKGSYGEVADSRKCWTGTGIRVRRQRVRNNLPGTPEFCPTVARTPFLERYAGLELAKSVRQTIADLPADLLARSASFLLLEDAKASFHIEGQSPPQSRIQRWASAIGQAGRQPLDLDELLRLQRIAIGDTRFVEMGLRQGGGFIGEHDRATMEPLPLHIGARHDDLGSLIQGMIAFERATEHSFDPVIAAAPLAFGFVNVHPFEDGNGRIHRYLIHHVLARRGFSPPGVALPVSAAILADIVGYRRALESSSRRVMPVVRWQPTDEGNVEVLNDTADFYRFFDATPHAEFLYKCVRRTVEEDLPTEADYLGRHDRAIRRIMGRVEMPDRTADKFLLFVRQNGGSLPERRRKREFAPLADQEVEDLERIVCHTFEGFGASPGR